MLSVDEALDRVLAEADSQPKQIVSLAEASGRVLAESISAGHDAPPFDNSAMDGFAVRAKDIENATAQMPVVLIVQGEVIAGNPEAFELEPTRALRINTGAPLPSGADAVVRVEDVEWSDSEASFVSPARINQNIRRAGEDYHKGAMMLDAGVRLDPGKVGLLASLGVSRVPVARRPRVALIASGDELVEPGEPLGFGQIYNSTRYSLVPLLTSFGAEVHDLGRVGDTREATRRALAEGLEFDVLVTTGGVSMGSHDFIRPTLGELGAREVFWKVAQRPGKPLFVAKKEGTLCFGLPGNPVSVLVTTLVYVRAALLAMQGASDAGLPWRGAVAGEPFKKKPGVTVFARADYADSSDIGAPPVVVPSRAQGSHQFSALATAAGIVALPEASGDIEAGEPLKLLEFDRLP